MNKYKIITDVSYTTVISELTKFAEEHDILSTPQFSTAADSEYSDRNYSVFIEYQDKRVSNPNLDYDFGGH